MSLTNKYGEVKNVSLVIPTLNEGSNIKEVFPYIPEFIDEIVVVDGNSADRTRDEILKYRKDTKIIVEKPQGKGAAMRTVSKISRQACTF